MKNYGFRAPTRKDWLQKLDYLDQFDLAVVENEILRNRIMAVQEALRGLILGQSTTIDAWINSAEIHIVKAHKKAAKPCTCVVCEKQEKPLQEP